MPEVAEAGDSVRPAKPLVINVFADGSLDLDGQPVTLSELTARLNEARSRLGQPTVVIRGDAPLCVPERGLGARGLQEREHLGARHHRPHRQRRRRRRRTRPEAVNMSALLLLAGILQNLAAIRPCISCSGVGWRR